MSDEIEAETNEIEFREKPRKEWFWANNIVFDEYAALIGPAAFAVYMALARHADKRGVCFPSYDRIAQYLYMGRSTVIRSIKKLEVVGLIRKFPRRQALSRGAVRQTSNAYVLLKVYRVSPLDVGAWLDQIHAIDHPPKKRTVPAAEMPPKRRTKGKG